MLIDNKVDRYPDDGLGIRTVWDFINLYSGRQSGQTGKLDIVTGYFTIRALSKLYRELPAEDEFRIVSSEMVREEKQLEDIKDLLNGDFSVDATTPSATPRSICSRTTSQLTTATTSRAVAI